MPEERRPTDRVRRHSPGHANVRIDDEIEMRVRGYADADDGELNERISQLEREWDIERVLQANAATIALTGVGLGAFVDRRWLALPAAVLPFLIQHAVQGWCPPVPIFRRLGVRTRKEIEEERYALKALRGDLDPVRGASDPTNVLKAIRR